VYTQIESEYIKHKIRTVSWTNHSYVDDLIKLARFIRKKPHGFAANMHFVQLKNRYPGDYLELLREHSQEEYERVLEEARKEKEKQNIDSRQTAKQEESLKDEWLRAGGTL
jgi:hypothetical protein